MATAAPLPPQAPPPPPAPQSAPAGTSLYVGDLHESITEAQLYDLFTSIGPVVSIRVCRDVITRRSLGYGYVNFQQSADAARALDVLNFATVNQQPIRIMFSQRDPSARKSGVGNIFIKNLDKAIDNKTLHDTFAQFGNIISAKVAFDGAGVSKGYGFVQFDSVESANKAIENVNGMLLADKQVFVGPFQRRTERETGPTKFTNVFAKNLAESVTDEFLNKKFSEFGTVTSAIVMKDDSGKSKGFGFVNFEKPEEAAAAVAALDGFSHEEKEWQVCRAQKKVEREQELKQKFEAERRERMEKMQGSNLYIKNLSDGTDDDKLRELFKEYGTVTSCKILRDSTGVTKGAGFVALSSAEEATRAVTEMNGKMVNGKPLYVALAQRKEERRMRLQAQFAQRGVMGMPGQMGPGGAPLGPMGPMGYPGGPQMFYPGGQQMMSPYGMPGPVLPPGIRPGGMQQMPPYMMSGPQMGGPQMRGGPMGGPMVQGQGRGGKGGRQGQMGGKGGKGGMSNAVRYNANARNMDAAGNAMMMMPGQMDPSQVVPAQPQQHNPVAVLASQLASAPPDQQRILLGEALYPLVDELEHVAAAKITGMLLEMDQSEVLNLIESPDALRDKVAEALAVLKAAAAQ